MEGLLQARHFDMCGIVNGIDYDVYNPETDSNIYLNYNAEDWRKKKYKNKMKLQEEDLKVLPLTLWQMELRSNPRK